MELKKVVPVLAIMGMMMVFVCFMQVLLMVYSTSYSIISVTDFFQFSYTVDLFFPMSSWVVTSV